MFNCLNVIVFVRSIAFPLTLFALYAIAFPLTLFVLYAIAYAWRDFIDFVEMY